MKGHHPSCKYSDIGIAWVCGQCGCVKDADGDIEHAKKAVQNARTLLHDYMMEFPEHDQCDINIFVAYETLYTALYALGNRPKKG